MNLRRLLKPSTSTKPDSLRIALSVLAEIRHTIGMLPAEHGGVLGGHPDEGVVTEFVLDRSARRTSIAYTPDDQALNRLFKEDWNPRGIRFMGFVHSHPGLRQLSHGDLVYSQRILAAIPDLKRLITPIVLSSADRVPFEIRPYAVVRAGQGVDVVPLALFVMANDGRPVVDWERELLQFVPRTDEVRSATPPPPVSYTVVGANAEAGESTSQNAPPATETFRRVVNAYDLELMRDSRVIYVGAGGAAGFIEDLARAGVGQHILIDPDVVSETNLATQQTYRRDIGRPKVDAIAERIRDINADALVVPLQRSLDDIDDAEFEFLACGESKRWARSQTLLSGLTDNFYAQARVNRLALQFGLASLCAQLYAEGRGVEVTFTHPDVTPACHRCVLSARYQAYLADGYENTVTSDGTPIFATTRLNALKGFIAMALLHHASSAPRWKGLLARIGNRNLVQVRLDPDLASSLGLRVFDRVLSGADTDRILFDETVWLPQAATAGTAPCPDCRGTGRLRDSIGTFPDTRAIRE